MCMPLIKAHVDESSKAGGLKFGPSLNLHPYFVYASSIGSGKSAHMHRLAWRTRWCDKELKSHALAHLKWLKAYVISTMISWAGPFNLIAFNPFMPNVLSHPYQSDDSISNLGLLGGIFHFYSNFKRNVYKQTVESLIRRRVLRRLIWFCTVCPCPTKRTLDLYGLKWLFGWPIYAERDHPFCSLSLQWSSLIFIIRGCWLKLS